MSHILLIEDDELLGDGLRQYLASHSFSCTWLTSSHNVKQHWFKADLVVLDRQLDGCDSLKHLPYWLNLKALPVIILTAKVDVEQRIEGLMAGAKDYMTKPFAQDELLARIITHLRPIGSGQINYQSLMVDPSKRVVKQQTTEVNLKPKEFQLLLLLLQNQGRVFHREELLNKIWGYQAFPTTRTVDNHILRLRQQLPELNIETHRGIGYRLLEAKAK
ncbi:response regulator transcription factor [Photobacterium sanguinicancri]|uniref:response regulator transcription factor n=1 Tax=Photobacterium sanguinicancri TaxID=875932 RepID=UPI0024807BB9|nr:response regulator transcription factor [Photobacterium sanguinicancri]